LEVPTTSIIFCVIAFSFDFDFSLWIVPLVCVVTALPPLVLAGLAGVPSDPEMNPLPSEAIFGKITMSAFEGAPLDIALRDCGIDAFAIVGIAMEIGIEPTVRQGADLGYTPVVVKDACGFGHCDAADRSIASLEFAGDALLTNADPFCALLGRAHRLKREHPHFRDSSSGL
jgi:biuret amidohydrolase